MSIDEIYQKSKDGPIAPDELLRVRQELDSGATGRQAHRAIEILGRAGTPERDSAMVRDFVGDADPELAAVALHVLADVWGLGERHRADMMRLISGIPTDDVADAKTQAISSAGQYLRDRRDWDREDCALFEALQAAATDESNLTSVRQWAAVALRGTGEKSVPGAPKGRPRPGEAAFDAVLTYADQVKRSKCGKGD